MSPGHLGRRPPLNLCRFLKVGGGTHRVELRAEVDGIRGAQQSSAKDPWLGASKQERGQIPRVLGFLDCLALSAPNMATRPVRRWDGSRENQFALDLGFATRDALAALTGRGNLTRERVRVCIIPRVTAGLNLMVLLFVHLKTAQNT